MKEASLGFEAFVVAVESGTISAAARELGIPRETLSRHLAKLEARLGVRLLHRGSRQLTLTSAGEALYHDAKNVVIQSRAVSAKVRSLAKSPEGLVRVSIAPIFDSAFIVELAQDFLTQWPDVALEIRSESAHIDLVEHGIDVAIRGGGLRDQDLVARVIGTSPFSVVGAPSYLERHGTPQTPQDLSAHDCVLGSDGRGGCVDRWPLIGGGTIAISGRFRSNDLGIEHHMVLQGRALGLLPEISTRAHLQSGKLERVLENLVGGEATLAVVYPHRTKLRACVREFIEHVVSFLKNAPVEQLFLSYIDASQ